MNKKMVALMLCVALLASALTAGTLAYFTSTDNAVNTMTVGNVEIKQLEEQRFYDDNGDFYTYGDFVNDQKLYPAVYPQGADEYGYVNGEKTEYPYGENETIYLRDEDVVKNAIDKIVSVKNTGSEDAYVRTWIAVEHNDEVADKIHFGTNEDGVIWGYGIEDVKMTIEGVNGGEETTYDVYGFVYSTVLKPEERTMPSLLQVWIDPSVTQEQMQTILGSDNELTIIAFSQAVQVAGFEAAEDADDRTVANTAWDALDAGFGAAGLDEDAYAVKVQEWIQAANN